jgi:hypothetical protein
VVEGSAPVKVRWTLNGQPLGSHRRMNALSLGDSGSVLTVPALDGEHSGNITCIAENFAGNASYTAFLNVTGNMTHTHVHTITLKTSHLNRNNSKRLICLNFNYLNTLKLTLNDFIHLSVQI